MPSYLVETYLGSGTPGECSLQEERARFAATELTEAGLRVSFEGSIHVPEDELCFFVFDAPDRQTARRTAERAGLDPIRVVATHRSDDHHILSGGTS